MSKKRDTAKGFSEYEYYNKTLGSLKECVFVSDRSTIDIAERLFALEFSEETEHIYKALYALLFISVAKLVEKQLKATLENHPAESARFRKGNLCFQVSFLKQKADAQHLLEKSIRFLLGRLNETADLFVMHL